MMYEEYDQEVPNLRVMLYDVSIAEALDYKKQIEQVDGVEEVTWLDDKISVSVPLEMMDQDTVDTWYKDGNALYQITIDETNGKKVIDEIRDIIGDDNCMDGTAVNDALAPVQTSNEIAKIMLFVLPLVFLILILTTTSWFEPVLFLITIGLAIMLNRGTNLMFGNHFLCNKCSRRNLTVGGIHGLCHLHFTSVCRESIGRRRGAGCHGGCGQTVSGKCTFQWIDDSQWICGIDSDAVSDRSGYGMGDGKGNCPQPVFRTVFPSGTDHDFL